MDLAGILAVDWSDWVVRLPGGGDSAEGALLFALILALVVYGAVRVGMVINENLNRPLWNIITALAFLLVVLFIARQQDDDPDTGITEDECAETLVSRCPPVGDDEGG